MRPSLRHACLGCGGSCRGVRVRLLGDEEARVRDLAARLGVDEPVVDGRLRFVDGACAFLGNDARCRLHAEFGAASKPAICRQYPIVVVETESGRREGVDPGCYTSRRTWRDGPVVDTAGLHANRVDLDPGQLGAERALVRLLSSGTVAGALRALCPGEPAADGLPAGFASRWITHLQRVDLRPLAARPEAGASLRAGLQPVLDAVPTWDVANPPSWRPEPEDDAFAVDVARRMVELRLANEIPAVQAVALLTLGGALACGWAAEGAVREGAIRRPPSASDDAVRRPPSASDNAVRRPPSAVREDVFGAGLAAWTRALRARPFWRALLPDPQTLMWLATGR